MMMTEHFIQLEHLLIGPMPVGQLACFFITRHTFHCRLQAAVKRLIFLRRDIQNLCCQCSKWKFFSVNAKRFFSDIERNGLKHTLLL